MISACLALSNQFSVQSTQSALEIYFPLVPFNTCSMWGEYCSTANNPTKANYNGSIRGFYGVCLLVIHSLKMSIGLEVIFVTLLTEPSILVICLNHWF